MFQVRKNSTYPSDRNPWGNTNRSNTNRSNNGINRNTNRSTIKNTPIQEFQM
jgi:hypothetical protein